MTVKNGWRYCVYEATPFGTVRLAAEMEAPTDRDALKQVREILPNAPGELRQEGRVVCRFGRVENLSCQG